MTSIAANSLGAAPNPDPYRVWLAEIMLQQTTTSAVIPYFERFTAQWPKVESLARAPLAQILREWAGLGYYRRAHLLHQCANMILKTYGGHFPQTEGELRTLPGIGAYSAAAIAAIAFDKKAAATDANIERVLARLYRVRKPFPQAKKDIRDLARQIVPSKRTGDYTQALMDVGATLCKPKAPLCSLCPFEKRCLARQMGEAESLPIKEKKKPKKNLYGVAFLLVREDGALFLRRRKAEGLLGGMMEAPTSEWQSVQSAYPLKDAPIKARWVRSPKTVRHIFTHIRLELLIYEASLSKKKSASPQLMRQRDARWVSPARLEKEALSSLMKKLVATTQD